MFSLIPRDGVRLPGLHGAFGIASRAFRVSAEGARGTSRIHSRNTRLHGPRTDRANESLDRFAERPRLHLPLRVTLYEMVTGTLPFTTSDPEAELVHSISRDKPGCTPVARLNGIPGRFRQS